MQRAVRLLAVHDKLEHEVLPDHPRARPRVRDRGVRSLYCVVCVCWAVVCEAAWLGSGDCDGWE